MKILAFNNFFTPKNSSENKINRFYLAKDTISFSGKTNINFEMKNLPEDAFPSSGLRQFMLESLENNSQADVVEIHRTYYSDLFNCKTLEEAKERYPEFENIVDAKNLDLSKKPSNYVFCQIANGEVAGYDIDSVSLMMLKKYYADLIPINADYIKENFNMSFTAFSTLLKTLNISMDKRYFKLLGLKMRASKMQDAWKNDEARQQWTEKLRKSTSTPEYQQKRSRISKELWKNPEYRTVLTSKITQARRDPKTREATAEITRQLWQDKDYQKKMKINSIASAIAWEIHPYAKDVYKEIAHEFPELKAALECKRKNVKMTDRQAKIISLYYKTCAERYPDLKKEVGTIQKELLQQWGYYDKDRDIDEILKFIESMG